MAKIEPKIEIEDDENVIKDPAWARECLEDFIDKSCCWGKGPLKKIEIISIQESVAYRVSPSSKTNL